VSRSIYELTGVGFIEDDDVVSCEVMHRDFELPKPVHDLFRSAGAERLTYDQYRAFEMPTGVKVAEEKYEGIRTKYCESTGREFPRVPHEALGRDRRSAGGRSASVLGATGWKMSNELTDASISDREAWADYLASLGTRGHSAAQVAGVLNLWSGIQALYGASSPLPTAGPTEDEWLYLAWNSNTHYLEVEFHTDGRVEWFYRDRRTGETEGTETPVPAVPEAVFVRLRSFVRESE